jgi:protein SCO1
MRWRNLATLATAGAVLWAGVLVLSSFRASASNATTRWGADYFPNVELTTQNGDTVHFYDDLLKGKSVAIDVIYTNCQDECPLETASMVQMQRLLGDRVGKDLFLYSITIDPRRDSPEVLKAYAEKFHVGPGWLFLTGDEQDIKLITRKMGLNSSMDVRASDAHATTLMVGDEPSGQWMSNSAEDNPRFLASSIGTFLGWRDDTPAPSYADAQPLTLDQGGYVFRSRCVGCHTIGGGDSIGPDLKGVTSLRDRDWLTRYVSEPDQVLAADDPIADALFVKYNHVPMPNLGLNHQDVQAVLGYLETQSSDE